MTTFLSGGTQPISSKCRRSEGSGAGRLLLRCAGRRLLAFFGEFGGTWFLTGLKKLFWKNIIKLIGLYVQKTLIMRTDLSLKSLVIFLTLLPAFSAWSQADKGFKLLAAEDPAGAWQAFQQVTPDDRAYAYALFGQGQALSRETFTRYNLDSAYHYFFLAETTYRSLPYKDRQKLEPFTLSDIRQWQKEIQTRAVASALDRKDPARVDAVLERYEKLPSKDKRTLMEARNEWLWLAVTDAGLADLFRQYHRDFAEYSPALLRQMESRLFDVEVGAGRWERYPDFARRFPAHSYVREGLMEKVEALREGRDPKAYYSFLDAYGRTPFRTLALDSLAAAVAYRGDLADCERYVREFAGEYNSDAVWERYYHLYKRFDFSEASIRAFAEKYPEFPFPGRIEQDLDFFVERKFEALMSTGFTVDGARDFLGTYPGFPGIEALWERYYKVYKLGNPTPEDLERFLRENPAYPFPDSVAAERLTMIDRRAEAILSNEAVSIQGYLIFLGKYPDTGRREAIWKKIYQRTLAERPGLSTLEDFAKTYPNYPFMDELQAEKERQIEKMGVQLLEKPDASAAVLRDFIEQYPESAQTTALWRRLYAMATQDEPTTAGLRNFIQRYPDYPFAEEVQQLIRQINQRDEKRRFDEIVDIRRAVEFLEDYPGSQYLPALEDRIYKMLAGSYRLQNLLKFLEVYPQSRYRQEILGQIYVAMTSDGSLSSVTAFEQRYPDFADKKQLERDRQLAALPNLINVPYTHDKQADFETYIRQAAPGHRAYRVLYQYIYPDLQAENWPAAAQKVRSFKADFGDTHGPYNELLTILNQSGQYNMQLKSISGLVNTPAEEYAPVISADGQTLLFCGRFRADNLGKEDIFIAHRSGGEWQAPELLRDLSSAEDNEAPEALSADNNTMLLFVDGELGISEKTAGGWSAVEKLPSTINRSYWQADARITADGKAMLFASEEGDYGKRDIYVSVKDEQGHWGEAINLGPVINTTEVDRTPFLHPDMKTLYFSSVGHAGLGKMDVFMSKRLNENAWTEWSKPVNLGTALNSVGNDWDFKVTTDGRYAYFTISNDIFLAELPSIFQPDRVATVSGRLLGIDGRPLAAEILWQDLETGQVVQISKSDPQTGDFFATLPKKGIFGYTVQREGFFPLSGNVDFTETVSDIKLEQDMVLATVEQMQEQDIRLPLNNLFFETAKYDIQPRSFPELNRLAEWIDLYDLQIEIMGHTDDVGEEADNLLLSQNRADAVKEYLLDRGAPADRITATGFGENQPVASNDTTEGRARNRRVEIRIRR